MKTSRLLSAALILSLPFCPLPTKAREKPEKSGQARAQTQQQGAQVQFGGIYTMQNDFNLQLLSASYTLEPHRDYAGSAPSADEKLLLIRIALKNARPLDNYYSGYTFTAVDEQENSYSTEPGSTRYAPNGSAEFSPNLKPGQGVGQEDSKPLTVAIRIPNQARVKKILVNAGRKAFPTEQVLRYSVAGFPEGDPKNTISPLPAYAADTADRAGALCLKTCMARLGNFYPTTYVQIRCDSIAYRPGAEGKQTAIVEVTARNPGSKSVDSYYFQDSPGELVEARDTNGQRFTLGESGARQPTSDEALGPVQIGPNEECHYRYFFEIPAQSKLQSVRLGGGGLGHAYLFPLSN